MRVEICRTEYHELEDVDIQKLTQLRKIGWSILTIDDREVLGFCEGCGAPILGGDKFCGPDAEAGVLLCEACGEECADGQVQGESEDQG